MSSSTTGELAFRREIKSKTFRAGRDMTEHWKIRAAKINSIYDKRGLKDPASWEMGLTTKSSKLGSIRLVGGRTKYLFWPKGPDTTTDSCTPRDKLCIYMVV